MHITILLLSINYCSSACIQECLKPEIYQPNSIPDTRDYTAIRETVDFPAGPGSVTNERRRCFIVQISDDDTFEDKEYFIIRLKPTYPQVGVSIRRNTTTIYIVDNDGN